MKIKVKNFESNNYRAIPNQFIISDGDTEYFQSYQSIIVKDEKGQITLDSYYWDYSRTTGKYRNQFLGETKKETQKKIDSGEYKLADLNNGE